ncbi:MAG: hypothetical protein RIQ53_4522 [Pseudomonadota bacterium]|jgi:uncharacterized membrane protein
MSSPAAEPVVVLDPERERSLITLGHVSYALHAFVAIGAVLPGTQASVGLLVLAFVIDLVKRDEAAGSWQASHFRWRIRSVLWSALAYGLTLPLWLLLIVPGWIAWGLISVWFLWRVLRGWTALRDRRPMPV